MKLEKEITESVTSGRESERLEVKADFTCLEKILKEIIAMANTNGGIILIGWEEKVDGYELKGINRKTLNLLKDEKLNDKVDKYCSKKIKLKLHIVKDFNKNGKTVGIIEVSANSSYLVVFNKDCSIKENNKDITLWRKGDIYVRHGSKTEKIIQQDLDEFLLRIKDTDYSDYKELVELDTNEIVDLYLMSPKENQKKIINNLFSILISFKEEWRYKAAGALSEILNKKDKDNLKKLIDIFSKSNIREIKQKILYVIREVGFKNVDNFLLEQLKLSDLESSGLAIAAIAKTKNEKTWDNLLKFLDKLDLIEQDTRFVNRIVNAFDLVHCKKNIPYLIKLLKHHNEYVNGNAASILVRLCEKYKLNKCYLNFYDVINNYIENNFKEIIKNIIKDKRHGIKDIEEISFYILREDNFKLDVLLIVSVETVNRILNRSKKRLFKKYTYSINKENKAIYIIAKLIHKKIEIHEKTLISFYQYF